MAELHICLFTLLEMKHILGTPVSMSQLLKKKKKNQKKNTAWYQAVIDICSQKCCRWFDPEFSHTLRTILTSVLGPLSLVIF